MDWFEFIKMRPSEDSSHVLTTLQALFEGYDLVLRLDDLFLWGWQFPFNNVGSRKLFLFYIYICLYSVIQSFFCPKKDAKILNKTG